MYVRFNLSFRDIEELMSERGVDVSYETIRQWVDKFGRTYANRIKSSAKRPLPVWHLDEVYTKINGKMVYLWRAIDDEGTVLDVVVQARRNTTAAPRLLRKLLRHQGIMPERIVTDKLGSYGAALKSWASNISTMWEAARITELNARTFLFEGENEKLRGLNR